VLNRVCIFEGGKKSFPPINRVIPDLTPTLSKGRWRNRKNGLFKGKIYELGNLLIKNVEVFIYSMQVLEEIKKHLK